MRQEQKEFLKRLDVRWRVKPKLRIYRKRYGRLARAHARMLKHRTGCEEYVRALWLYKGIDKAITKQPRDYVKAKLSTTSISTSTRS